MGISLTTEGAARLNTYNLWDNKVVVDSFTLRPMDTLPLNPKFNYAIFNLGDKDQKWVPLLDQEVQHNQHNIDEVFKSYEKINNGGANFTIHEKANEIIADKLKALRLAKSNKPTPHQAPEVGTTLVFNHSIDGDFGFLHSEKYGWENGDSLEVIHKTTNHNGCEVFIVLNTQPDMLNTAAIYNVEFFDTRTPKQKFIEGAAKIMFEVEGGGHQINDITLGALYDSEVLKEMLHEKL